MSNSRSLAELDGSIRTFRCTNGVIGDGVRFRCPSCPPEHQHSIVVTWSGGSLFPSGSVWRLVGTPEIATLTLQPSINCDVAPTYPEGWDEQDKAEDARERCRFHGFVTNGQVTW